MTLTGELLFPWLAARVRDRYMFEMALKYAPGLIQRIAQMQEDLRRMVQGGIDSALS